MPRMRRLSCLVVSACCLLLLAGCGKKTVGVNGKLVLPSGVKLVDTDTVNVSFVPEEATGMASGGQVSKADLSFSTRQGKNPGTVPGKYKVVVQMMASPGKPDTKDRTAVFGPLNKLFDAAKTPLRCEVTDESEQSFIIDLNKKSVTKN
jgi:hypothetical protein